MIKIGFLLNIRTHFTLNSWCLVISPHSWRLREKIAVLNMLFTIYSKTSSSPNRLNYDKCISIRDKVNSRVKVNKLLRSKHSIWIRRVPVNEVWVYQTNKFNDNFVTQWVNIMIQWLIRKWYHIQSFCYLRVNSTKNNP